jgi:hypothetical protein
MVCREILSLSRIAGVAPVSVRQVRLFDKMEGGPTGVAFAIFNKQIPRGECLAIVKITVDGYPYGLFAPADVEKRQPFPYNDDLSFTFQYTGNLVAPSGADYRRYFGQTLLVFDEGRLKITARQTNPLAVTNISLFGFFLPRSAMGRLKPLQRLAL